MRFIDPKVSRRQPLPLNFPGTTSTNNNNNNNYNNIGNNSNHCRVHPAIDCHNNHNYEKNGRNAADASAPNDSAETMATDSIIIDNKNNNNSNNINSNINSSINSRNMSNNVLDDPVDSKVLRTLIGHRKGSSSHEEGFVYEADGCSSDDDDDDDGPSPRSIRPRATCLPQHREHDCEDDDDSSDYRNPCRETEKCQDAGTVPTAATSFYSTDSGRSHASGGTSASATSSHGSGSAATPPSLGEDSANGALYGYENKMEGRVVGVSGEVRGIMSHLNGMMTGRVVPPRNERCGIPAADDSVDGDESSSNGSESKKSNGSVSRGNSGGSERTEQTEQSGESRGFGSHTTQSSITLFSNYTQEGHKDNGCSGNGNGNGNGPNGNGNPGGGGGGYGANAANVISSYGCYNPGNGTGNGERRSSISSVTLELSGTGWLNPPKNAHDSSLNKSMSISHLEGQGGYDDEEEDDDDEDDEVDSSERHRRQQHDPHRNHQHQQQHHQQPYQQDPRRRRSSASLESKDEEQDMVGTLLPVNGGHGSNWIKSQSFHAMSSCGGSSRASTVSSTVTGTSSAFGSASGSGSGSGSASGSVGGSVGGSGSASSVGAGGASTPKRSGFRRHTHYGPGGIPPRENIMIAKAKQQRQQQQQMQQRQKKQQHPYHGYTTGSYNSNSNSSMPSVASVSTCSSFNSSTMTDGNGSSYYYNDNSNIIINSHTIDNDNNHNSISSSSYASSSFVSAACPPPPPPPPPLSSGNNGAPNNNHRNNDNSKSGFTASTNSSFFSSKTQSSFFSSGTTSTSTSTERSEAEEQGAGGGGGSSSFLSTAPSNGSTTTTSSTSTKVTRGRRLSAVKNSIPSAHRHNRSSEQPQQQQQQRRNRSTSRHSTTARGISASGRTDHRRRRSSTTERDTTYNSCNSSLYYSTYSTKDSAGSAFSAAASNASNDFCEEANAPETKSHDRQRRHRSRSGHRRGGKSRSASRGRRGRGDSVSSQRKSGGVSAAAAATTPTTPVKRSIFSTVKDTIVKSKSIHVVYPPEVHRNHNNNNGEYDDDGNGSDYHAHSAPASTAELLLSLQETNHLNESAIETLQKQLRDMTNERDAFRTNGEKVLDVLSKQKSQLEMQLEYERREMAAAHEKEKREWEERALKWKEQVRVLEEQAKRREGSLAELEERLKKEEGMRGERIKTLEGQVERLVEMQMKKAAAAAAVAAVPPNDSPTSPKNEKSCDVANAAAVLEKEVKQSSNSSVPPPPPPQRKPRRRATSPPESPSSSVKMTPEESSRLRRYMQVEHVEEGPSQSRTTVYAPAVGLDMAASTTPQEEWDIDETSMEISAIETKYRVQLQKRASDIELLQSEVNSWKEKYGSMETKYQLLEKEHDAQKETKSRLESELSRCKKTIADQLREIEEREEEEDMKEQDWEDRLARVLNEKDRLARENEHMKNLAAPFLHSSFNCSVSTGISTLNDEIAQQIVELAEENSKLVDKCRVLEEELKEFKSSEAKAKSRNHDLKSEWENYKTQSAGSSGNSSIKENQSDLSHRVSELETNKASLEKSIMTLIQDLEFAKKDTAEATNLIQSLRSENDTLRANQGDKKAKIRHFVQHLRTSFVTEGSEDYTTSHNSFSTHSAMTDKEQTEALAMIEEIQLENEELRASMEEAMGLAGRMNEKMISFVSSHEATVQEYESKLKSLTDDLRKERLSREAWEKEKEELLTSMEELKHEVEEAHSLVETCESLTGQLNLENTNMKKDLEKVSAERAEAYETLRVLQAEIDSLRKSVNEAKERAEGLTMNNNNNELPKETRDKMRALIVGNSKLSKDLAKEKCILECLQASFDKLQAENQTIKEMVVALRQENGRLRDGEKDVPPTPPLPRTIKPPQPRNMSQSSFDIEARLKKIEKENKGLRDANELLSTKLFDEMEKTDSLRTANEGLAARICKLVSFIQQNSGTTLPPPPPQKKTAS